MTQRPYLLAGDPRRAVARVSLLLLGGLPWLATAGGAALPTAPPALVVHVVGKEAPALAAASSAERARPREVAVRGHSLRTTGPRGPASRHPAGASAPDLLAATPVVLHTVAGSVDFVVADRPGLREGVSHADGIRGPPVRG